LKMTIDRLYIPALILILYVFHAFLI
jgi:hypothetical protein